MFAQAIQSFIWVQTLNVALPSNLNTKPIRPFSHQTFVKYIGVISKSAAAIDKYLLIPTALKIDLCPLACGD
jgi:hypothetical protein